jgi:hypothetical protein
VGVIRRPSHAPWIAALALAASLLAPRPALAAPPDADDAEVRRRLAFLEDRLDRGTAAAQRWWYGWYGGWLTLSVVEAVAAAAVTNPDLRKDAAVSAFGASLGVVPFGLFPFPASYAAADLRALPEATPAERRRKLARGEHLLRASAEAEKLGRGWLTHVLSIGVAAGVGVLLGVGYKRPVTGLIDGVGGIGLSELKIFTQPTAAIDDLRAYEQFGGGAAPAAKPAAISWAIAPLGGGLAVAGRF